MNRVLLHKAADARPALSGGAILREDIRPRIGPGARASLRPREVGNPSLRTILDPGGPSVAAVPRCLSRVHPGRAASRRRRRSP